LANGHAFSNGYEGTCSTQLTLADNLCLSNFQQRAVDSTSLLKLTNEMTSIVPDDRPTAKEAFEAFLLVEKEGPARFLPFGEE
jgi:hypothetical protein